MPFLSVCFAAGALVYFTLHREPPAWLGGAMIGLAGIGFAFCRTRWVARAAMMVALACSAGFFAGRISVWRAPPPVGMPRGATTIAGIVRGVDILPSGRRISIDAPRFNGAPPLGRFVRLRLQAHDRSPLMAGDEVTVRALLHPPPPMAEPGGSDLRRDAFFSGLGGSGWAIGPVTVSHAGGSRLFRWWTGCREAIAQRFVAELPQPEGAIAATLFSGDQTAMPQADRASFSDSGLAHLLAVAGLHIAIVMGFFYAATRFGLALSEYAALRWPCKEIAAAAGLAMGLLYLLLTGAHVPILRSFTMASLVVLAVVSGRRALSVRSLGLAAMAILAFWPQAILDVSFQMSFSAVLALIEGHRLTRPWITALNAYRGGQLLTHIAGLAITSLLAGLASMPFAAAHFGHATAYFVPANLLAVPVTTFLVMPSGLVALALMPFHLEWLILPVLRWGLHLILLIAHLFAAWPGAIMAVPPVPGWALILIASGMAWIGFWRGGLRWVGVPLLAIGLIVPWCIRPPDLLVSADFKLIGLRRSHDIAAEQLPGASDFTLDAWRQYLGFRSVTTLPPMGQGESFVCDTLACRLGSPGKQALLVRQNAKLGCAGVMVVISEAGSENCPGKRTIGPATIHGAVAIWLDPTGARLQTAEPPDGNRPWSRILPPSRPLPDLPMALAE